MIANIDDNLLKEDEILDYSGYDEQQPTDILDEDKLLQDDNDANSSGEDNIDKIKCRLQETEEEVKRLEMVQQEVERKLQISPIETFRAMSSTEAKMADERSIYVGNVDYGATALELEAFFKVCGSINRVTIPCNKFTGQPKGFAYIEFTEKEFVDIALRLDGREFRERIIKIKSKRTNQPGMSATNSFPRIGRGGGGGYYRGVSRGRGRGVYRGGYRGKFQRTFTPY